MRGIGAGTACSRVVLVRKEGTSDAQHLSAWNGGRHITSAISKSVFLVFVLVALVCHVEAGPTLHQEVEEVVLFGTRRAPCKLSTSRE